MIFSFPTVSFGACFSVQVCVCPRLYCEVMSNRPAKQLSGHGLNSSVGEKERCSNKRTGKRRRANNAGEGHGVCNNVWEPGEWRRKPSPRWIKRQRRTGASVGHSLERRISRHLISFPVLVPSDCVRWRRTKGLLCKSPNWKTLFLGREQEREIRRDETLTPNCDWPVETERKTMLETFSLMSITSFVFGLLSVGFWLPNVFISSLCACVHLTCLCVFFTLHIQSL